MNRGHGAFTKVLLTPDIRQRRAADGAEVVANAPDEFLAQLKVELSRWEPLVRGAGVKVQ